MTQEQQEAMDIVVHMSAKEIQEFAIMLKRELELKIERARLAKLLQHSK